jgi:hypothetical protein
MRYLLKAVDTYRVPTVEDVEILHEELLADPYFDLVAFSYKTKQIKAKGEVIEEYQVVSATKVFTDEKIPERVLEPKYVIPEMKSEDF